MGEFKKGDRVELDGYPGTYLAFDNLSEGKPARHIAKADAIPYVQSFLKCRPLRPDLKIDVPVWVKNQSGEWKNRHFARWEGDNIVVWVTGKTSHTALDENDVCAYEEYSTTEPVDVRF